MLYARFEELTWHYSEDLDVYIGVSSDLPSNGSADVVYARLEPNATLRRHYHHRPTEDGYEAFFFFAGASIRLLLSNEEQRDISERQPFHLAFGNEEIHGLVNLDEEPLYFEVICAPRHVEGEEVVTD